MIQRDMETCLLGGGVLLRGGVVLGGGGVLGRGGTVLSELGRLAISFCCKSMLFIYLQTLTDKL